MKALVWAVLAFTFVTILSPKLIACSCERTPPIADEFRTTETVAIAQVVHVREYDGLPDEFQEPTHAVYVMKVKKTYKGATDQYFTIQEDITTSCANFFREGQDYVFWIDNASINSPGEYEAPICTRTGLRRELPNQIRWLERNSGK